MNKFIRFFICFFVFYTPFFANAAGVDWEFRRVQQAWINEMQETKKIQAELSKTVTENGSKVVKTAIVESKPTASKVGSSMLKRVNAYAKAPGVQAVGVYAVVQLIEAIGWVMKDGTYVKIKETDPGDCVSNSCPLVWFNKYGSPDSACKAIVVDLAKRFDGYEVTSLGYVNYKTYSDGSAEAYCKIRVGAGSTPSLEHIVGIPNPDYVPENPKPITHTLTPALLGAAMLGQGYSDPADSSVDDVVNTGRWTGVPEAYTPDTSGTGNELANELAEKANNAKPTPDGKASSSSDSRYQDDLSFSDKSNDRSWTDEKGTAGESSAVTDPSTGETKGNFKLPAFCDWASAVCDWFDWTKEEPEKPEEPETPQVDDKGIFGRTFDIAFSLSSQCPPDIPVNFESTYISGNFTFSMNWLCIIFSFMAYPLVFLSHCVGIWILYEAVIQKEIKW